MKETITVSQYAQQNNLKIRTVYSRIEAVEKLKKRLADLETESFNSLTLKNELKMVKLRHKIKDAIDYYKEDGHIFIFVED